RQGFRGPVRGGPRVRIRAMFVPTSVVSMVSWPAIPDQNGALFLALLRQLEQTERLPPAQLEALQFEALTRVLRHACATVPYYRDRPVYRDVLAAAPLDAESWRRLPILTRAELQDAGRAGVSEAPPAARLPL